MSCAKMVALRCWPFELSSLNELYRGKLVRSITHTLCDILMIFCLNVYHCARMGALPCWPFELSPLNELVGESLCAQ